MSNLLLPILQGNSSYGILGNFFTNYKNNQIVDFDSFKQYKDLYVEITKQTEDATERQTKFAEVCSNVTVQKYFSELGEDDAIYREYATSASLATKNQKLFNVSGKLAQGVVSTLGSALKMGAVALVSWAVSAGMNALLDWLNEADEEAKSALESINALSEDIDEYLDKQERIDELKSQYTDIVFSTTDLTEKTDELDSVHQSLNGTLNEGNDVLDQKNIKIQNLTDNYGKYIAEIQEAEIAEKKSWLNGYTETEDSKKVKRQTAYENAKKYLSGEMGYLYLDDDGDAQDTIEVDLPGNWWTQSWQNMFNDLARESLPTAHFTDTHPDSHSNQWYQYAGQWTGNMDFSGNPKEVLKDLETLREYLVENDIEQSFITKLDDQIADLTTQILTSKDVVKEYEKILGEVNQGNFSSAFVDTIDTISTKNTELLKAISNYDTNNIIDLKKELESLTNKAYSLAGDNPEAIEAVDNIVSELKETVGGFGDSAISEFDTIKQTLADFKSEGLSDLTTDLEKFNSALKSIFNDESIDTETMWELIELDSSLSDKFKKTADGWTISTDELIQSEKKLQEEKIETIKLNLQAIETAREHAKAEIEGNKYEITEAKEKLEQLKKALVLNGNNSNIYLPEIETLQNDISKLENKNKELNKSIEDSEDDYNSWSLMLDEVSNAATGAGGSLSDLIEAQKEAVDTAKNELITAYKDMIDAVDERISDLEDDRDEALNQIGDVEGALNNLHWEKTLDGINQAGDLTEKLNRALAALNQNTGASKLDKLKDVYDKINESLDDEIDKLEEEKQAKIDNIKVDGLSAEEEDKRHEQVVSNLEKEIQKYEELLEVKEKELSDYDSVISAVDKYIGDQIDGINEQIDALNEQKEAYSGQIETLEELKSSLQNANDEIDRQLALEKAQNALESARNNKNTLAYHAGAGFRLEANKEDIANAENDLRSAQLDAQIANIDKQIEAIQNQSNVIDDQIETLNKSIEAWNKYAEQWSSIANNYENSQNKIIASQILGSNWTQKVAEQDTGILTRLSNKYVSTQKEIEESINVKLDNLNNELNNENSINEKRTELFESEEARLVEHYDNQINALKEKIDGKGGLREQLNNWYYDQLLILNKEKTDINNVYQSQINDLEAYKNNLQAKLNEIEGKEIASWQNRLNNLNTKINEYNTALGKLKGLEGQVSTVQNNINNSINKAHASTNNGKYMVVDPQNKKVVERNLSKYNADNTAMAYSLQNHRTFEVIAYNTGGVDAYTGLAQLHGQPNAVETIFNATDGRKLYDFIHNTTSLSDTLAERIVDETIDSIGKSNISNNKNITFHIDKVVSDNPVDFVKQLNSYFRSAGLSALVDR